MLQTFIKLLTMCLWITMIPVVLCAESKPMRCTVDEVVGNWAGDRVGEMPWRVTFSFRFSFRADGTYSYVAGQGHLDWTSHDGNFQIAPNRNPNIRMLWPCEIYLSPQPATVQNNPANPLGLAPLGASGILQDKPQLYRLGMQVGLDFQLPDERFTAFQNFTLRPAEFDGPLRAAQPQAPPRKQESRDGMKLFHSEAFSMLYPEAWQVTSRKLDNDSVPKLVTMSPYTELQSTAKGISLEHGAAAGCVSAGPNWAHLSDYDLAVIASHVPELVDAYWDLESSKIDPHAMIRLTDKRLPGVLAQWSHLSGDVSYDVFLTLSNHCEGALFIIFANPTKHYLNHLSTMAAMLNSIRLDASDLTK